ncbi:MAG: ABC transporter permease [Lachnospiraceae bacterium]|nr:ABC transporter permease [Lachnospiraceae bacterium]
MNRTQWKDLLREIRKNRGRFLSLLFIVALGCAFYTGIRSSEPDMTLSADRYYDETDFCDIRIVSTLGLTGEDLEAVRQIPGVLQAEGGMTVELFADGEDSQPIMNVLSLGETVNQFTVAEGRLPETEQECFADVNYMTTQGAKIGDTITLLNTDKESPEELSRQSYTIVGYGTWAWYLNLTRGTASIGDGSVDAFLGLKPEVFTQDYYTNIYLTVEGAKEENTYEERYDEIVDAVKERLDGIADVQVSVRRSAITAEGEEAIADAREQIADARKELSDAEQELTEGEEEYADGLASWEDGKAALDKGREEYEQGLADWESGRQQYLDGLSQYQEGLSTYRDGLTEYESGKAELEEGRAELEASRAALSEARAAYESGLGQWNQAGAALRTKEQELQDGEQQILSSEALLEQKRSEVLEQQGTLLQMKEDLELQKTDLELQKSDLEQQQSDLEQQQEELELQRSALEQQLSDLKQQKAVLEEELGAAEAEGLDTTELQASILELSAGITEIEFGITEVDSGLEQIGSGLGQIRAGLEQISEGLLQLDSGLQQVHIGLGETDAGLAELDAGENALSGQKAVLEEGKAALAEGWEEWTASGAVLEQTGQQLESAEQQLAAGESEILTGEAELSSAAAELSSALERLSSSLLELEAAEQELADGEKLLQDSAAELDEGEQELQDSEQGLADAREALDEGWEEYRSGKAEAEEKIADAEQEIADGEQELLDLPAGEWYVLTRDQIQTSVEYGMDAERIGKIANVFPVIFFLVAALVSLTTMTRMVEEERMLIGTMKALGYGKLAIISKYLVYAAAATLTGGIGGVLFGGKVLPYVIMTAYGMLYTNVPYMLMPYNLPYSLTAIGLALLCTVGAAFAACWRELLSAPAALMRPPAPKSGKKILLERIGWIWRRMNFSMKSTVRNLFRYKKRFIMTVVGIGGCMAVLLVSYGLHDSIAAIVDNQYKRVWTYSAYCSLEENLEPEEKERIRDELVTSEAAVADAMLARNISLDVSTEAAVKNVYLYVVEGQEEMDGFLSLHDRVTGETYTLSDEGVILSEKLARSLGVSEGGEVRLEISDSEYRTVKVTAAAENYLNNYVYMTPKLYQEVFGIEPVFNECAIRYAGELSEDREDQLAEHLLSEEGITSVSLVTSLQETVDGMMNALNLVVWVLVIAAGLLVFVVSYNLNNINISERRRELASLKVLGFYDMEVAMYVYRENIFLTLFGIFAGLFMGTALHRYLITTLEVEMIMFGRQIRPASYLYSSLLTIVFSVLVNILMYYKLKQIDMVESLKSVE